MISAVRADHGDFSRFANRTRSRGSRQPPTLPTLVLQRKTNRIHARMCPRAAGTDAGECGFGARTAGLDGWATSHQRALPHRRGCLPMRGREPRRAGSD